MPLYRVKPGREHGQFGQYKAGALVEHTEAEAAGFLDKLELAPADPVPVVPPDDFVTGEQDTTPHELDTSLLTVAAVLQAVTNGEITVDDALSAEYSGKNRKTLIEALLGLKDGTDSD